jgi:hypothetical protein
VRHAEGLEGTQVTFAQRPTPALPSHPLIIIGDSVEYVCIAIAAATTTLVG